MSHCTRDGAHRGKRLLLCLLLAAAAALVLADVAFAASSRYPS